MSFPAPVGNDKKPLDPHYAALRQSGLRPNLYRLYVLRVLAAAAPEAVSAVQVFQRIREGGVNVSQGTVYRVLRQLEQSDLVLRDRGLDVPDNKHQYRSVPAGRRRDSYTVVCRGCGQEHVVTDKAFCEQFERQAQRAGFAGQLDTIRIEFTCARCAR